MQESYGCFPPKLTLLVYTGEDHQVIHFAVLSSFPALLVKRSVTFTSRIYSVLFLTYSYFVFGLSNAWMLTKFGRKHDHYSMRLYNLRLSVTFYEGRGHMKNEEFCIWHCKFPLSIWVMCMPKTTSVPRVPSYLYVQEMCEYTASILQQKMIMFDSVV